MKRGRLMRYHVAQICLNGHIITGDVNSGDSEMYCSICGKETIDSCINCGEEIRGDSGDDSWYEVISATPYYCISCGNPYPWTTTILNNAVELISLDENLPDEQIQLIKTAIPDLIVDTPTTPLAVAKYKKVIKNVEEPI